MNMKEIVVLLFGFVYLVSTSTSMYQSIGVVYLVSTSTSKYQSIGFVYLVSTSASKYQTILLFIVSFSFCSLWFGQMVVIC
jgi:hypothetical protein